jgi:hypothetical protein
MMTDTLNVTSQRLQMENLETSPESVAQNSPAPNPDSTNSPDSIRKSLTTFLKAKEEFSDHALSFTPETVKNDEKSQTRYLSFFLEAARYFTTSTPRKIGDFVDHVMKEPLYTQLFGSSGESIEDKKAEVENQLFSILGTWLGLSALFHKGAGNSKLRPILLVPDGPNKTARERPLDITIETLLETCVFIPRKADQKDLELPDNVDTADEALALIESTRIERWLLNTFTLKDYAHIEICWVNNISRHMILSQRNGREELELFEFPQVTQIKRPFVTEHQFADYMTEVWMSYSLLFPIKSPVQHSGFLNRLVFRTFFCWCKSCKVRREFETHNKGCKYSTTALFEALNVHCASWNTDFFPILWHRILKIREYQAKARPATVRALWKDRRHPVQFYGTW